MRIIRDASQDIEKKIICKHCGCELGYVPIDIKKKTYTDYLGGRDDIYYIVCPNCRNQITVSIR